MAVDPAGEAHRLRRQRYALPTGVALDVTEGGPAGAPPILFLHGFPESARTWRFQLADLARDHRVAAPDQRGFAGSDKPKDVAAYRVGALTDDVFVLADQLGFERFCLVGHDWGGAVAWAAALQRPERVSRLVIANAPHPYVFQQTLWRDPAQRAASQYILDYRAPHAAETVAREGLPKFLDRVLSRHLSANLLTPEIRAAYLAEWSQPGAIEAMLNWYKASPLTVPVSGDRGPPPAWLDRPFPKMAMPVLVIWGRRDQALLPVQLQGLGDHVPDLTVVELDADHFVTWEQPAAVTRAIRAFLDDAADQRRLA